MTKNAGMEEFYDKMGGEFFGANLNVHLGLTPAVTPEEACGPVTEFFEVLDMSMTGKFWAPSEYIVDWYR